MSNVSTENVIIFLNVRHFRISKSKSRIATYIHSVKIRDFFAFVRKRLVLSSSADKADFYACGGAVTYFFPHGKKTKLLLQMCAIFQRLFATGNPFLGTKLLGNSIGRGLGALRGVKAAFLLLKK